MEKIKSVVNLFIQNTLASGMNYLFRFQYQPLLVPLLYELIFPLITSASSIAYFTFEPFCNTDLVFSCPQAVVLFLQTKEFFSIAIIHSLLPTWCQTTAMLLISLILEIV